MGYDGRRAIFVKNITVPQPYSMALDGIKGRPADVRLQLYNADHLVADFHSSINGMIPSEAQK